LVLVFLPSREWGGGWGVTTGSRDTRKLSIKS
jgi:hypothetical protein